MFPLRLIKNDDELDCAVETIKELFSLEELSNEQQDYMDVLALIIEEYEDREHPIRPPTFIELLRSSMRNQRN